MVDSQGTRNETNRLEHETSAYLRQHMHNPVDWYPWGAEALARARSEDRPLLVSIGYSACHWCHVMERESFEDPETAALMNQHFVCIKVDREERPDVDQIYMDTATAMTGHGGWPLTVFCTPDGRPFHAGTYYPPEPRHGLPSFRQLLEAGAKAFREQRSDIDESASGIVAALGRRLEGTATQAPGAATAAQAAMRVLQRADAENGGFGDAPKFPTPPNLELLLAALDVLPERKAAEALEHVVHSCREMARRGLYDHLGGGFHRYCVDAHWGIPHFEKMLYDQGQLLRVYAEAWRRSGGDDPELVWPVLETVAYLRREMTGPEGGYFASQDADSEGVEGKFYVWTPESVRETLGDERGTAFCEAYGVNARGNFEEGTTHLHDVARKPRGAFADERAELLAVRARRVAPGTDRKRVASWNGLAISGLARAGSTLGEPSLVSDAAAAADFVLERMQDDDGQLLRVFNEGQARVPAFLDDHAALLEACLDLARAGAGERFLAAALRFAEQIAGRFYDDAEGDLFLTPSDAEPLAHRPRSDHDGATPHSTGLAVLGLLRVASITGRGTLEQIARRVLESHALPLEQAPEAFPTLARAALVAERGLAAAVIVSEAGDARAAALAARARSVLAPEDAVLVVEPGAATGAIDAAWLNGRDLVEGHPTAYVCRGFECSLPIVDAAKLAPADALLR